MAQRIPTFSFSKIATLLLTVTGIVLAIYSLGKPNYSTSILEVGVFSDRLAVPFLEMDLGPLHIPLEVDTYLLFQKYEVIPPTLTLLESHFFAFVVLLVAISALAAFSYFKKFPFLGAGIGWILLLTFANLNGLHVGGLNSILPLLLLLTSTLLPTVYFHIWGTQLAYWIRWIGIAMPSIATLGALVALSPLPSPTLYLAEQSLVMAMGMCLAWIFWQGHGILSGLLLLISKANAGLQTRTSLQFASVAVAYLLLLLVLLLQLKGDLRLPLPSASPLFLLFPLGWLGGMANQAKWVQNDNLAGPSSSLNTLHVLGFGISLWTLWKLGISYNQPAIELLKHLLLYSQLGFSLFFSIYVGINFFPLMHQGKPVHAILFKPFILPYYHLRIGGLITLLVITTYLEATVASQASAMTTQVLADYYHQSGQKLEASILYESSWDRYRFNPKAKNLTAQLLFDLKQPSLAKEHLEESFSEVPQVDNILLLSNRLQRESKFFEAVFYLEKGLEYFPSNPYLGVNLSLLYTLIQRQEDALLLMQKLPQNLETVLSNQLALQVKLGKEVSLPRPATDLIGRINRVAAEKKRGVVVSEESLKGLRALLEKESSPLLVQAGYRNLLASARSGDSAADLKLLDSLSQQEDYLEGMMSLQETAVLTSLGMGRINDAVKNLNGLAFRNPGDAAYYLNMSGLILAQQLDFEKAARDFALSQEKGFQTQQPIHRAILHWAEKGNTPSSPPDSLHVVVAFLGTFNQTSPNLLFDSWNALAAGELKLGMAAKLLSHKAHGLSSSQLQEIGRVVQGKVDREADLQAFLQAPDWTNSESIRSFTLFLGGTEELNANPYFTPLILAAVNQTKDPVQAYELLNSASEFNKDPILWAWKIKAALGLGLDNYAAAAREEMKGWVSEEEIEKLLAAGY